MYGSDVCFVLHKKFSDAGVQLIYSQGLNNNLS